MIRLTKAAEPQTLKEKGTAWTNEFVQWCTTRIGPEPRRYSDPAIRQALEEENTLEVRLL